MCNVMLNLRKFIYRLVNLLVLKYRKRKLDSVSWQIQGVILEDGIEEGFVAEAIITGGLIDGVGIEEDSKDPEEMTIILVLIVFKCIK